MPRASRIRLSAPLVGAVGTPVDATLVGTRTDNLVEEVYRRCEVDSLEDANRYVQLTVMAEALGEIGHGEITFLRVASYCCLRPRGSVLASFGGYQSDPTADLTHRISPWNGIIPDADTTVQYTTPTLTSSMNEYLSYARPLKHKASEHDLRSCLKCGLDLDKAKKKQGGEILAYMYGRSRRYYCEECYKKHMFQCQSCSNRFDKDEDESVSIPREKGESPRYLCSGCAYSRSQTCFFCGDDLMFNVYHSFGEEKMACEKCAKKHLSGCSECGSEMMTEQMTRRNGRTLCTRCSTNYNHRHSSHSVGERRPSNVVQNVGNKGVIVEVDGHSVGVEIEVEGLSKSTLNESDLDGSIGLTHDGSLEDGLEVLIPPRCGEILEGTIKHACDVLREKGLNVSVRCGVHIHFGLKSTERTNKQLLNIFYMYYNIEDILFSMLPYSRRNNRYCKPLKSGFLLPDFTGTGKKVDKVIYKTDDTSIRENRKGNKYDGSRYYFLNLHSVFYRGTLEIRSHSGTLDPKKILYWIYLNQKIIEFAEKKFTEESIVKVTALSQVKDKYEAAKQLCELIKLKPDVTEYFMSRIKLFDTK